MKYSVCLHIQYNINTDEFKILPDTTIKNDVMIDFVVDYTRTQIGIGKDNSIPNKLDLYDIALSLDLSDDSYKVVHNCGNDALCLGILLQFLGTNE